jgi:uncharacterized membrane protein
MEVKLKTVFRFLLIGFYLFAGANHFINPDFYSGLIPDYIPAHNWINYIAGITEMVLALGVAIKSTRKWAVIALILMLLAFVPSHIYFIQIGACVEDGLCVAPWIAWLRLLLIHPLLILWAWWVKD